MVQYHSSYLDKGGHVIQQSDRNDMMYDNCEMIFRFMTLRLSLEPYISTIRAPIPFICTKVELLVSNAQTGETVFCKILL